MRIKPYIKATSVANGGIQLNDALFRWLLIPAFGIIIPLATNMVDHHRFSQWEVKFIYLYNIGIAFIIYQGNRYLFFTMRSYFDWHNKPIQKLMAMVLGIVFYTVPITVLLMAGWYFIFEHGIINWQVIGTATPIVLVCVVFVVHTYETAFLVAESESEMVKTAQLQQAKSEAELQALKSQIDPHFIFNSLNTLSHLIEQNATKAKQFNDNLADVYRYILHNKSRDLVLLREEMIFLQDYFSLLKIRFEQAVRLDINLPETCWDEFLIPPISLQILVENAIKHNEFSDAEPMVIDISLNQNTLLVSNPIKAKTLHKPSSKIGLQNLNDRYKLITNKEIEILANEQDFVVILPVLKID